jgi:hypothetical protein
MDYAPADVIGPLREAKAAAIAHEERDFQNGEFEHYRQWHLLAGELDNMIGRLNSRAASLQDKSA